MSKPNVSRRKLFIDAFLETENYNLTDLERKRIKKEGFNYIQDGKFWFKVCKEYERLISCG
jgi:hypothetical protein